MFTSMAITSVMCLMQYEEERKFVEKISLMPPDQANTLIVARREAFEKARIEATAERRHREIVDAIKSSRSQPANLYTTSVHADN